jgi:RimJ/RimL family protein N-acetyltransferase
MQTLLINTNRLRIRDIKPADIDDFYTYRCNPEITKYQGFDVFTREQAIAFIEQQQTKLFGQPGQWVQYGIENTITKQLIGDCAIRLMQHEPRIAEIGITISHLHHKKGYAKEAMVGILNFLFIEKNIHRVVETVDAENIASINLLKSIPFRQEGNFIENIFFKGKWGSEYQFALLKKEWDIIAPGLLKNTFLKKLTSYFTSFLNQPAFIIVKTAQLFKH